MLVKLKLKWPEIKNEKNEKKCLIQSNGKIWRMRKSSNVPFIMIVSINRKYFFGVSVRARCVSTGTVKNEKMKKKNLNYTLLRDDYFMEILLFLYYEFQSSYE